ncbi:MAG: 4-(cytidine 5'-diphospho)-2-C-methyl-D-erythritol kinase [Planctomycetota bacterium]
MSSSSTIELEAPAKLNLWLEVLGRLPDGYHEIDTFLAEIDLADTVRLEAASEISLTVEGLPAPADASNLAWRAAAALGVGARIHLVKRIPAGAGLGGGSSDAAAVLKGLVSLYGLTLPDGHLAEVAVSLGADVPFFLHGGTARCRGIGERVEPRAGGGGRRFLLVVPDLNMSTAAVYGALPAGLTGKRQNANVFARRYFGKAGPGRAFHFNRLQAAAESLDPRLREVREKAEALWGTTFTMSGSGSSYFSESGKEARPPSPFEAGGVRAQVYLITTR